MAIVKHHGTLAGRSEQMLHEWYAKQGLYIWADHTRSVYIQRVLIEQARKKYVSITFLVRFYIRFYSLTGSRFKSLRFTIVRLLHAQEHAFDRLHRRKRKS